MSHRPVPLTAISLIATALLAGCGSSSSTSSASHSTSASAGSPAAGSATTATTSSGGGVLAADARSAATGDIPDTQVFLVFTDHAAGWSMKYPEGWTRSGSGPAVTFRDKNNLVHVAVAKQAAPSAASMTATLSTLRTKTPGLTFSVPQQVSLASGPAFKVVYRTQSAPNPVTGKRVELIVDRYAVAHSGRVATVDLGTPKGVDNVDAYRMMIKSFQWR